jgi:mycothiol synthase
MTDSARPSTTVRTIQPPDIDAIRWVMEASLATDAIPGYTAADIDRSVSRLPADPDGALVAVEDGRVVGYCIPRHDDLTVHPAYRRHGHGRRLVARAQALAAERGLPYLMLHGPTHLAATRAFIEALGASYHSSLWQFELAPGTPVPAPNFGPDLAVRTLGDDLSLAGVVDLMNATFADHPTPLSWTLETVQLVHDLPEFDANGILLVAPAANPDRHVAFTKVELSEEDGRHVGFVALIGVLPEWRGRGIGRELLHWGIDYLRRLGAGRIDLSVVAINDRALGMYRRTGFVPTIEWPHYIVPVAPAELSPREPVPAS